MHVPPGRNVVFCLSELRRQAISVEQPVQEQEARQQGESASANETDETPTEAELEPQEAEIQES